MPKESILDKFSQRVVINDWLEIPQLIATAHPAPEQFLTNWTPKDKLAMLIQKVKYYFLGVENLDAVADRILFGLCVVANQPADGFEIGTPGVIDFNQLGYAFATAVGMQKLNETVTVDFTSLKGGGLVAHPSNVYMWARNDAVANLAAPIYIRCECAYNLIDLTDSDWQELWQLGFISQQI